MVRKWKWSLLADLCWCSFLLSFVLETRGWYYSNFLASTVPKRAPSNLEPVCPRPKAPQTSVPLTTKPLFLVGSDYTTLYRHYSEPEFGQLKAALDKPVKAAFSTLQNPSSTEPFRCPGSISPPSQPCGTPRRPASSTKVWKPSPKPIFLVGAQSSLYRVVIIRAYCRHSFSGSTK